MQLFLDSFGASLGVRNGMFRVKPRHHDERLFAVREVNAIFLTRGVHLTTDALMLAITHEIPVLLINSIGHPIGQVWSGQYGSIATIRKNQALFATHPQGLDWIREVLGQKMQNQVGNLAQMAERTGFATAEAYGKAVRGIQAIQAKMDRPLDPEAPLPETAAMLRGWEGTASRYYFEALSAFLPPSFRFSGRSKRPAYDPFNALLNYLYGMLYAYVELALMKAGLDPYNGVLHADEYNRPTLVFDVIEWYRHWAEWVGFDLCHKDLLPQDAFVETERDGVRLVQPGKGVVIDSLLSYLQEKEAIRGEVRRRQTRMDLDAQRLAARLKVFSP